MAKYRDLFLEEATEHLSEISSALLDLEKETSNPAAIDLIFRMAHSIKGMAASLSYDAIVEVSHRLEDRMQNIRAEGRVSGSDELALLFRCVECIETMVKAVRDGEVPASDPETMQILDAPAGVAKILLEVKKKAQNLTPTISLTQIQTQPQ